MSPRPTKALFRAGAFLAAALVATIVGLSGCVANPERDAGILKAHPKWRHRMLAAERLAIAGDTGSVPDLIEALRSDEDLFVRNAAAQALGRLKDPRAVEPLIAAMLQDIVVRDEAAKALAAIDGPIVETRLMSLARDTDPIAREHAVTALGLLNIDGHLSAFFEAAMADPASAVRRRAVEALGASSPSPGKATDPLVRFLRSSDATIRAHAAEDMGLRQEQAYVPFLIEAATDDADEGVRGAACVALGRIGTDEAADALIRLLEDRRAPAVQVLKGLVFAKKDKAVEPIIEAYGRKGFPRHSAVEALAEFGGPRVTAFLTDRLRVERGATRRAVLDALAEMKDQASVEALIAAFESDPANQVRIIRALEGIGGEAAMRFVARAAVDAEASPAARSASVQVLKRAGAKAATEVLREASLSGTPAVAQAAREAMEALGLPPASPAVAREEGRPPPFKPPPP